VGEVDGSGATKPAPETTPVTAPATTLPTPLSGRFNDLVMSDKWCEFRVAGACGLVDAWAAGLLVGDVSGGEGAVSPLLEGIGMGADVKTGERLSGDWGGDGLTVRVTPMICEREEEDFSERTEGANTVTGRTDLRLAGLGGLGGLSLSFTSTGRIGGLAGGFAVRMLLSLLCNLSLPARTLSRSAPVPNWIALSWLGRGRRPSLPSRERGGGSWPLLSLFDVDVPVVSWFAVRERVSRGGSEMLEERGRGGSGRGEAVVCCCCGELKMIFGSAMKLLASSRINAYLD
jgi:hypothetical protein